MDTEAVITLSDQAVTSLSHPAILTDTRVVVMAINAVTMLTASITTLPRFGFTKFTCDSGIEKYI